MSQSLRDQLLKAGLVSDKQARQAEREASQQQRRSKNAPRPKQDATQRRSGDVSNAAKAQRDRELNLARQAKAQARAQLAELRQLLEPHRLQKPDSDDYFNFIDGGKIRRVPVDGALRAKIVGGQVLIVRCGNRYELLPADSAERVRERHADSIVPLEQPAPASDGETDWYQGFDVPDDLTW